MAAWPAFQMICFFCNEYLSTAGHERLRKWSNKFGKYMLPATADLAEIEATKDADEQAKKLVEKVTPVLEPLWSFFVALCHALQNGENELRAHDAYWLGLVDEVVGENLFAIRQFVEFTPDPLTPEAPPPPTANGEHVGGEPRRETTRPPRLPTPEVR